jgi:hypothetical protein
LEYTATDTLHGQLNATAMCYQTIASPVSSTHWPKLESSPNYPCQIRPLRCRKDQPVTPVGDWEVPRVATAVPSEGEISGVSTALPCAGGTLVPQVRPPSVVPITAPSPPCSP